MTYLRNKHNVSSRVIPFILVLLGKLSTLCPFSIAGCIISTSKCLYLFRYKRNFLPTHFLDIKETV